jgi:hypothetical protein
MGWPGRAQRFTCWTVVGRREARLKEHAMRTSQNSLETIGTFGIDVGKNTFHLVGLDKRGVIVLQQKVTRHLLGRRLSNIPRCLIGMEAHNPDCALSLSTAQESGRV